MASRYDRNFTDQGYLMKYCKGEKVSPVKNWVLQFKIELAEIQPLIWRRILVPPDYNFWDLHIAVQDAMGWRDCHLHHFDIKAKGKKTVTRIGIPDFVRQSGKKSVYPGWEIPVGHYFNDLGTAAEYLYDYGDSWRHTVLLEGYIMREKDTGYPLCIAGERACPPESCGGEYGYLQLIKTLSNPKDPDYEMMKLWVGEDWQPERFDRSKLIFSNPRERWKAAFPTDRQDEL